MSERAANTVNVLDVRVPGATPAPSSSPHPLDHRIPPPIVTALLAVSVLPTAWLPWPLPIAVALRTAIGAGVVLLGFSIVALGFFTFRRAGTTIDPTRPERASALVTRGIFRYTRNPMYVGMAMMLAGWAVLLGAPAALLGAIAFVAYITRFQIIPEERAMATRFGVAYSEYLQSTRRWI